VTAGLAWDATPLERAVDAAAPCNHMTTRFDWGITTAGVPIPIAKWCLNCGNQLSNAVARRPIRGGELVTGSDVHLRDDWAELLVQLAAFAHVRTSPGCRGYTTWSSGRACCGCCGWGMSARMHDVGTPGSAWFSQAALARVGQAIALAVGEVIQALFEAVLPCRRGGELVA
jgi:hypothetical protein